HGCSTAVGIHQRVEGNLDQATVGIGDVIRVPVHWLSTVRIEQGWVQVRVIHFHRTGTIDGYIGAILRGNVLPPAAVESSAEGKAALIEDAMQSSGGSSNVGAFSTQQIAFTNGLALQSNRGRQECLVDLLEVATPSPCSSGVVVVDQFAVLVAKNDAFNGVMDKRRSRLVQDLHGGVRGFEA